MSDRTLARPYAQAVFALALDAGSIEEWSLVLNAWSMAAGLMSSYLSHPGISREDKIAALMKCVPPSCEGIASSVKGLAVLLLKFHRVNILSALSMLFDEMARASKGEKVLVVESVDSLPSLMLGRLVAYFEKRWSSQVVIQTALVPELLAGVKCRSGDWVWDASLKKRLSQFKQALVKG